MSRAAQLVDERGETGIEAGEHRAEDAEQQIGVHEVGRIASSTPGYCTFTATGTPDQRQCTVDLANRSRRDRLRVPGGEDPLRRLAQLLA